jgi:hypothetical protein
VANADLAWLRRPERHIRILGQLRARVEGGDKSAIEAEYRDRSGRGVIVTGELRTDHAGRVQPEPLPVKRERPIEVTYSQGDHMNHGVP